MIYFLFMITAVLLYPLFFGKNRNEKNRFVKCEVYFFVIGAILFLIAALRNQRVGNDTATYIGHFYRVAQMEWKLLFVSYKDEPGFYIVAKLISYLTNNPQWLISFISLLFSYSVTSFVYKNSKNPSISFVLLVSLAFFAFSLTGLRQTIAISIIILSIEFVKKRKLLIFLLYMVLAYCFHNSAVFAIPVYFLFNIRITSINRLIFMAFLPAVYLFRHSILAMVQRLFYNEHSLFMSPRGSGATLVLYIAIWILYFTFADRMEFVDKISSGFESMLMVGIAIQILVPFQPNIFRVALYYQIGSLVIVPKIIHNRKVGRAMPIVYLAFLVVMFFMYFIFSYSAAGANPYSFFWQ